MTGSYVVDSDGRGVFPPYSGHPPNFFHHPPPSMIYITSTQTEETVCR
jgi:hypothetical protein